MNQKTTSKSSLFLMELIISIFFFSLAGGICIQLFVHSHLTSRDSINLNHGILWSQNLAEAFYTCDDLTDLASLFPDAFISGSTLYLFFDKNWEPLTYDEMISTSSDVATTYLASLTLQDLPLSAATCEPVAAHIQISMLSHSFADYLVDNGEAESVYELTVDKYEPITSSSTYLSLFPLGKKAQTGKAWEQI